MRSSLVPPGLLFLTLSGTAGLVPGPDLARRIEQADTIVVATLRSGNTTVAGDRTSSAFVLQVDRVLKGSLLPGTEIAAAVEGRGDFIYPQTTVRPVQGEEPTGMWFLRSAGGVYSVVPRAPDYGEFHRAPVWLPSGAPRAEPGRTPAESVSNELIGALRWLTAAHGNEMKPAARVQVSGDRGNPHRVFGKHVGQAAGLAEALRTLPPEVAARAYRQLADDPSPHLRGMAVAGLIASNQPEGLKRAAREWKVLAAGADVTPIVQSLMGYHNDTDPAAVRALAGIALENEPVPFLKENASYALRVLHTPDAMPALVALLDAAEPSVRANALSGICLFVRNAMTVTPDAVRTMSWTTSREPAPFRTAETDRFCWLGGLPGDASRLTDHAAFWKAWWHDHEAEVMGRR